MTAAAPALAIVNNHADVCELLVALLDGEGYRATTHSPPATIAQIGTSEAWLASERPEVVLYDISYPYADHGEIFQALQRSPSAAGVSFVVTTTSPDLVALTPDGDALPVVSLPFDIDQLLTAVQDGLTRLRAQTDATSRAIRQSHTTIARAADLLRQTRARQADERDGHGLPPVP